MSEASVEYSPWMVRGRFIDRPNRFLIRCELEESGRVAEAHLPDSGKLKELLLPGRLIYLLPNNDPKRKTNYSAVCVERPDRKGWVSINSVIPNKIAGLAFKHRLLPEYKHWDYVRAEYSKGHSRWDHLLSGQSGEKMVVEVKGVTLVEEDGSAYFPDAVTTRGTKHVLHLADIAEEEGWQASLLFVGQRSDISAVTAADWIDPAFSNALNYAEKCGVQINACRCEVTPEGISLLDSVPVNLNHIKR